MLQFFSLEIFHLYTPTDISINNQTRKSLEKPTKRNTEWKKNNDNIEPKLMKMLKMVQNVVRNSILSGRAHEIKSTLQSDHESLCSNAKQSEETSENAPETNLSFLPF